jgi:alkanesulfonate monooxygenase SsuD/methylene tetrahydromethanopterin reductase-like flavin-dependent oxidoreductase (luciferase family)
MRFGLFGSAQARRGGPDADSGRGFRDFIDYNVEAEALGFHSTFVVEHHFTGFGQVSACLNLLTWLGARTRTLRLGTAVIVLPWHNPVLLAEQAATLDLLSGGRLDFGVGRGYRHNEFTGFCLPMAEAEARYEESLAVITKAWTSDQRFSHHGNYWQFEDIIVEPPPAQRPHPPFWVGAGSRASIAKVAARGHNLLLDQFAPFAATGERVAWFRQEVEAQGGVFDPMTVGVTRAYYVARDEADKRTALERRRQAQARTHALAQTPTGDNKASIMSFADTTGANEDSALYGTPDEICRKIEALEKLGVRYLLLTGGGAGRDNLRRFAREVMPAFTEQAEARSAAE